MNPGKHTIISQGSNLSLEAWQLESVRLSSKTISGNTKQDKLLSGGDRWAQHNLEPSEDVGTPQRGPNWELSQQKKKCQEQEGNTFWVTSFMSLDTPFQKASSWVFQFHHWWIFFVYMFEFDFSTLKSRNPYKQPPHCMPAQLHTSEASSLSV